MRLGIVTYRLAEDWDLETILQRCQEIGLEGVELRTTHAHGVEADLTPSQRAEVRRRFEDSGVELVGLGTAFEFHSPDPDEVRRNVEGTKEYVRLAHDVGAAGVKVRPNGLPPEVPVERTLEQIGRAVRECAEFAQNWGVEIRVEVHGRGTALLPNMQRIMEVADHPNAKVCWNSNSSDLLDGKLDATFPLVADRIGLVHINELWTDYPYRDLFRRLHESGYRGFCLAEIPPSPEPIRLMRYYRALFAALQPTAA